MRGLWGGWPAHMALPLLLMRESMKSTLTHTSTDGVDLSMKSPKLARSTSSDNNSPGFDCQDCGRIYKLKSSLRNHQKWECGKEPQFKCPCCPYRAKQKMHMARHMERMHRPPDSPIVKVEIGNENVETESGDMD
ncbi:longitudinals lacking protein, isoforms F/I/K/T-like [Agrilus planipennis]|uniref:Longitudinals lacking protein, isoforms F/I/K/T-like n=1 Tax=Agrilus planipennis TaxID=224129 RepID=A0A7F5QUW3_AGRPL|nr:longitudinals lacking protein, isoforms F/I/K/T-like isoform X1 [Agrilus planipennis]XP_025828835.1 longitudinals lacking protein, isoforms F/I/K/T-like isoform X2 [Agrilus planipennis]XP_025835312.1 longitudinals lacking protein, isoforms F/I/K/T-like [Agrilus planipennis]